MKKIEKNLCLKQELIYIKKDNKNKKFNNY